MKIIQLILILSIMTSCSYFELGVKRAPRELASSGRVGLCARLISSLGEETYYNEAAANLLRNAFKEIEKIDPIILGAEKAPGWTELDHLRSILESFEEFESKYQFPSTREQQRFFQRVFIETYPDQDIWGELSDKVKNIIPLSDYQPTEYDLILNYRRVFERINSFFPRSSRIELSELPADEETERLLRDAREFYREQVSRMSDLIRTSGYDSYEDYLKFLRENKDKLGKDIVDLVLDGEVDFVMRRPQRGRWWVARTGFHNQFVTGSSRGSFDHKGRNSAEAALIGLKYEEYKGTNNDLKPKYGSIQMKRGSDSRESGSDGSIRYGEDIYIFKNENIKSRLTWTVGDSLGYGYNISSLKKASSWDEMFIPWDFRALAIPYMLDASGNPRKNFKLGAISSDIFPNFIEGKGLGYRNYLYWESQTWGPLRLGDVKEFIFSKEPPSGDFLGELLANGIKIFDGRKSPSEEWIPPKSLEDQIEEVIVAEKKPINEESIDVRFDYGSDAPPKGKLEPTERRFGTSELSGSTEPQWYVDEDGVEWLLKDDKIHDELQTAAEVISSSIYRHLGFNAPSTHIVFVDGKRYAAVRSLGKGLTASALETNQSKKWKLAYFIGALLKDYDRIYGAKNNFDLGGGEFAMFDFGGTLGSKARGEHKKVWPGWEVYSDAIGMFEDTREIEVVFGWFKDRYKPEGHAWNEVTKEDALEAIELLKTLTNDDILKIVMRAKYSRSNDSNYMIAALSNRRDIMIEKLLQYFP